MKRILMISLMLLMTSPLMANEKVKHCKNARTGEVIVVQAGYPCPYPTHQI